MLMVFGFMMKMILVVRRSISFPIFSRNKHTYVANWDLLHVIPHLLQNRMLSLIAFLISRKLKKLSSPSIRTVSLVLMVSQVCFSLNPGILLIKMLSYWARFLGRLLYTLASRYITWRICHYRQWQYVTWRIFH